MSAIPDFRDEKARREWIIANADYFTIIWTGGGNKKAEVPTLEGARQAAKRIVDVHHDARFLVYAVFGPYDTYVETLTHKGTEHARG